MHPLETLLFNHATPNDDEDEVTLRIKKKMRILAVIFIMMALLAITSCLSQQAKAAGTFSIAIDTINGYPPSSLPAFLTNAIHLEGSANSTDFPGLLSQYQVQVNWGDGTLDSNSSVTFTQSDLDGDGRIDDFKGTWHSDPDHYYNNSDTYTITVKLYHQKAPGGESSGDIVYSANLTVTVGITFHQTGISTDFTRTVLTVDGTDNWGVNDLPVTYNWTTGTNHTFAYGSPLVVTPNSKQYMWTSTTGLSTGQSGTINVTGGGGAITGNYETQYYVTLAQNGLDGTSTGTVLTVDSTTKTFGDFDISGWFDSGTTYSYETTVSGGSGKRFVLTSVTGPTSPIGASGTVTGNYKTQYQVSFAVNPAGEGTTNPTGSNIWADSGSLTIQATPSSDQTFSSWSTDTASITFASATSPSTTAKINGPGTITANFQLATVQITITSSPTGSSFVKVDGGLITTPQTFTWTIGSTHSLEALSPVSGGTGIRHVWANWSDGEAQTHNYVVPSSSTTITATYGTFYLVVFKQTGSSVAPKVTYRIDSGPAVQDTVEFSVWVGKDSSITCAYESVVAGGAGTQYILTTTSPASPQTVTGPLTITGTYTTQYYLTVVSAYDTPSGSGWYDTGSTAYATLADATVPGGAGVQHAFTGWSCDTSGSGLTSNAITMDGPKTALATWKTQYYLTLETGPSGVTTPSGEGWYDEGDYADISTDGYVDIDAGSRFRFDGWTTTDMAEITAPTSSSTKVYMDKTKTVTANYVVQYKIVFDQTGVGTDFTGTVATVEGTDYSVAGLNVLPAEFWWDKDSSHSFSFASPLLEGSKRYVWTSTSGLSAAQSGAITVTASGSITGDYKIQYYVTFTQSGLDDTSTGTVLTIDSTTKTKAQLPFTNWFDSTTTYSFSDPVSSAISGKRFSLTSVTGSFAPAGTVYGNYHIEYQVTFAQTGLDDATGTVVTISRNAKVKGDLPLTDWFDSGTTYSYETTVSGGSGKRFVLTSVTGPTSPIGASGTVTGNYKTQYQVSFAVNPAGGGTTNPTGSIIWVDSGSLAIQAMPSFNYAFSSWSTDTASITFATATSASTAATINGAGTITANFQLATVQIIVTSNPIGSGFVKVDGNAYATPQTFSWTIGSTHTLEALSPVSGGTGIQYVWTSWNDSEAQTHSITVPSTSTTYTANFKTQWQVTFSQSGVGTDWTGPVMTVNGADHDKDGVSFWADDGDITTFSYASPLTLSGKRYVLTGVNATSAITISDVTTIVGSYKTQYYLTVVSAYDSPGGAGWYDGGSTAYATLTDGTVSGGAGVQYVFTSWGTDASGTGLTSNAITMNAPKTAVANWKPQYMVSFAVNPSGAGATTPSGTNVWEDAGTLSISATTNLGYTFSSWSSSTGSITFNKANTASTTATINGPGTITATFTQNEYTLTVTVVGSGSVVKSPNQATYHYGDVVQLTANAASGWSFSGWSGDLTGSANPDSITIDGNKAVTATFAINTFTITASAGPGGSISPSGSVTVNYGDDQGFTITADAGYHISDVLVDGSSVGAVTSYTFTNVQADHTIAASFAINTFTITFTESELPSGTSWSVTFGGLTQSSTTATITFTGITNGSYSWNASSPISAGAGIRYAASPLSGTMDVPIQTSQSITYAAQYYLTVTSAYGTPGGEGWYDADATAYASVSPLTVAGPAGTQYDFTHWSGDASGTTSHSDAITMNAPKTAVANWKTRYYLVVNNGGHSTAGGEGWYDANTNAYATISPLTVTGASGTQCIFNGWSGDATGSSSPSNPILMNAPKVANATWTAQYFVTFSQTGLDGSATGIVVTVNGSAKAYGALPFTLWVDNGASVSYSYASTLSSSVSGKRFDLVSVTGLGSPITVTGSVTVTGNYNVMYYLDVISQHGNPIGSGWYPLNSDARFSVTTPIDHGNQTLRVFIGWSGDASASTPSGSIIMTKPSSVTAAWQTQYLVTFNTTLPGVVLSVPNVPVTLPAGSEFFGTYYAANSLVAVGPAPDVVSGENGIRYVLSGWTLDGEFFTTGANISFVVKVPHQASVVYSVESLLAINATGVSDHFTANVTIAASPPVMRELSPTSPIQDWIAQGADTALSISTPNKIGHGEWAIFQKWAGQIQGEETSTSFAMLNPTTVNAVFFQVNPVAVSIPYSIIAAIIAMFLSIYIERRKKTESTKKLRAITWGITALATALIIAAIVSAIVAIGYSINVGELLDFTNWAVVFVAIEAAVFLLATIGVTKKIQSRKLQQSGNHPTQ